MYVCQAFHFQTSACNICCENAKKKITKQKKKTFSKKKKKKSKTIVQAYQVMYLSLLVEYVFEKKNGHNLRKNHFPYLLALLHTYIRIQHNRIHTTKHTHSFAYTQIRITDTNITNNHTTNKDNLD